jgi:nicotinamide riboside kinase
VLLLSEEGTPWVDDGLRVLSGRRAEHTRILREELEAAGREYVILSGSFAEREREAERLVADLIGEAR